MGHHRHRTRRGNFTSGHQEIYVNFRNEDWAPLLFTAGGEDNIVPLVVTESNIKHYRHAKSITHYKESTGRSHYIIRQVGWEEAGDHTLEWATEQAAAQVAP